MTRTSSLAIVNLKILPYYYCVNSTNASKEGKLLGILRLS